MIDASAEFRRSKIRWSIHLPLTKARLRETKLLQRFRARGIRDVFEDVPRWLLCLLLIAAPWAYGTTFTGTKDLLADGLLGLIGFFVLSLVLRHRWPRMHWLPGSLTFVLLAQGWLMTWNPKLVYDSAVFYFHVVSQPVSFLPGTVDQTASAHQMLLVTGLVGAFWVANDLAANPRWLDRVWLVISLTGVSLIVLGVAQRITGAQGIFWNSNLDCGTTFFATFRYHANAGAFINLVFPLIVGRTLLALHGPSSDAGKAFWTLASLLTLASAFINVSRAATVITMVLTIVLVSLQVRERIRDGDLFFTKGRISIASVLLLAGVSLLVWGVGFKEAYTHWTELVANIASNGRFLVYGAILEHMLPATGLWGFGPGTFGMTFPFFTNALGARAEGIWQYTHCDYLQTVVEWGVIGGLLWFVLFGTGIARAAWVLFRFGRQFEATKGTLMVVFFFALISVLLHSTVDFPLQIAALQLYACVILGLLTSLGFNQSLGRHDSRQKKAAQQGRRAEPRASMPNGVRERRKA
jgi:hypothetical protein